MGLSGYNSQTPSTRPIVPLDSSTVILVRETGEGPFQIFLGRRHRKSSFTGGVYVFPGGRVDLSDTHPALLPHLRIDSYKKVQEHLGEFDLTEERMRGLMVCALRELFEEAGVLLAYSESNSLIGESDVPSTTPYRVYRYPIYQKELSLLDLAQKEHLTFALDRLIPFAHWITPEMGNSKRFDTRFFLVQMPVGQEAEHDRIELTESIWISPSQALDKQKEGSIQLMPPTLKTIEEMQPYSSIHQLFEFAQKKHIYPVLPQPLPSQDGPGFKLPHDPQYTIEEYRQPPRPKDPSRIMLIDGVWQSQLYSSRDRIN